MAEENTELQQAVVADKDEREVILQAPGFRLVRDAAALFGFLVVDDGIGIPDRLTGVSLHWDIWKGLRVEFRSVDGSICYKETEGILIQSEPERVHPVVGLKRMQPFVDIRPGPNCR